MASTFIVVTSPRFVLILCSGTYNNPRIIAIPQLFHFWDYAKERNGIKEIIILFISFLGFFRICRAFLQQGRGVADTKEERRRVAGAAMPS
jgi:hypothetical protein